MSSIEFFFLSFFFLIFFFLLYVNFFFNFVYLLLSLSRLKYIFISVANTIRTLWFRVIRLFLWCMKQSESLDVASSMIRLCRTMQMRKRRSQCPIKCVVLHLYVYLSPLFFFYFFPSPLSLFFFCSNSCTID